MKIIFFVFIALFFFSCGEKYTTSPDRDLTLAVQNLGYTEFLKNKNVRVMYDVSFNLYQGGKWKVLTLDEAVPAGTQLKVFKENYWFIKRFDTAHFNWEELSIMWGDRSLQKKLVKLGNVRVAREGGIVCNLSEPETQIPESVLKEKDALIRFVDYKLTK